MAISPGCRTGSDVTRLARRKPKIRGKRREDVAVTHAAMDDEGLVCAFTLAPLTLHRPDILKQPPDAPVWLHFNINDARARRWLQERAALPAAAREVLLSLDMRIQSEVLADGFVAVLGDLPHDFHDETTLHTLRIYVDGQRMITSRRHPLRSSDLLRRELQAAGGAAHPIQIFERMVDCLGRTYSQAVTTLANQVDDAEEEILAGRFQRQGKALGRMRRSLARLRRHLTANRAALGPLPARLPATFGAQEKQDLRQAIESLDGVAQDLELVQERARLLQEEIAGLLTEATNRNLFLLSMVTTTLLPITLITGVFGMNVGGLPGVGTPAGFRWVMVMMVVALVVTLLFLRGRRPG
jgi:zinc transporter